MLSLESLRRLDPDTVEMTDESLEKVRAHLYDWGGLMFDDWQSQLPVPKHPIRVSLNDEDKGNIKA